MTAACPSFLGATALFDYVAWQEDEGQADTYTRLGAFAHHLVDLLARNDTDELIGAFRELEQLLVERSADGDDAGELDAVVRMGVIESLQNICSHDDVMVDEERFHLLCGPETAEIWNEVDQVWTDAARRPSPVPRPTEAEYLDIADPDVRLYLRIHRRKADDGTLISASDVLRLETFVADITYTSKRAYRKALVSSALFGLAIAVAVAFLLVNRGG
ncbi:MAG: hypothetical protein KDB33_11825 [Acidimicrobiales bacterium]|nr:hypothetical protein [Acidimicrobiales bacterium]MCB1261055.1 hypothetical protein [Acidimicrobiales bacterium]